MKTRPYMSYRHRVIAVLLTSALFGYGNAPYVLADSYSGSAGVAPYGDLIEKYQRSDRQALRVRADLKRQRLWVLTLEHVDVYDTAKRELIRRIELPDWFVADIMCPPDMALDDAGTAFVSNNVEPRLLQIDPVDFRMKEHRLTLISTRKGWEIGFGGLAFGEDGALYGVTALAGALFRIDLAHGTATEITLSEPATSRQCAVSNDQCAVRCTVSSGQCAVCSD